MERQQIEITTTADFMKCKTGDFCYFRPIGSVSQSSDSALQTHTAVSGKATSSLKLCSVQVLGNGYKQKPLSK
jgi:hypothetical protein